MELVAEYQGKPTPDVYADMLNSIGKEYNNGMVVVENNSVGFAVLSKLQELGYNNIYFSVKSTHEYVEQVRGEHMSNAIAGFSTTSKTRPLIIAKMEEFIRNKLITIYSSRTISEMKTFIWRNGKPQAMKGYHDDLIMALAIACWVRDTAIQHSSRELNYKKAFLNAVYKTNTNMNTQIKGQQGYKQDNLFDKMDEAKDLYAQYKWIIK